MLKEEFDNLSKKEKYNYLIQMLNGNSIYGKVIWINASRKKFAIEPYSLDGKKINLFDDGNRWRPPAFMRDVEGSSISTGDYVHGELILDEKKGPYVFNPSKYETEAEFRKKLYDKLRSKWEKYGFSFRYGDWAKFDGKIAFDEWASDKVEALLEKQFRDFEENEIEKLIKDKRKLQKNIEFLKEQDIQLSKSVDELNKKEFEAKEKYKYYLKLGIIDESEPLEKRQKYNFKSFADLIEDIWRFIWNELNLYYDKSIIRCFMTAIRTNQLIILWGSPGTGKTSLPRAIAKAIGAKCTCVQVQSDWTDNQDLLGYYNPVERRYTPTKFLDAIIDAKKNPNQMHFVVLDEMNLSRIEYYFSELLNVFTWDDYGEGYKINLYSKKLKKNATDELEMARSSGEDIKKLVAILKDMQEYEPDLIIPKNIRFIGTLNSDETTKSVSPKVQDRSCIMELRSINKIDLIQKFGIPEKSELVDTEYVSQKIFEVSKNSENSTEMLNVINNIRKCMENNNISVSNRLNRYVEEWNGAGDNCVSLDDIILTKILPLLDRIEDDDNLEQIMNILEENKCIYSMEKLNRMRSLGQKSITQKIRYWEN